MAEVLGLKVPFTSKSLEQIVAPVKNIVAELEAFEIKARENEAKASAEIAKLEVKRQDAASQAKLANNQADKLRGLIIV